MGSLRDMGWLVASTTVITDCSSAAASSRVSAHRPSLCRAQLLDCGHCAAKVLTLQWHAVALYDLVSTRNSIMETPTASNAVGQ